MYNRLFDAIAANEASRAVPTTPVTTCSRGVMEQSELLESCPMPASVLPGFDREVGGELRDVWGCTVKGVRRCPCVFEDPVDEESDAVPAIWDVQKAITLGFNDPMPIFETANTESPAFCVGRGRIV